MYIYYLIFSHLFALSWAALAVTLPISIVSLFFWALDIFHSLLQFSTENRARTLSIKNGNDVKIEEQTHTHVTFCCWDASSLDIARTNSITHSFFMFVRWNHKNKRETHNTSTDFQMRSIHSLLIVLCINFQVCCRLNDIHYTQKKHRKPGTEKVWKKYNITLVNEMHTA